MNRRWVAVAGVAVLFFIAGAVFDSVPLIAVSLLVGLGAAFTITN